MNNLAHWRYCDTEPFNSGAVYWRRKKFEPNPFNFMTNCIEHLSAEDIKGSVDFALITVREDEFTAVLNFFPPTGEAKGEHRTYEISDFKTSDGSDYRAAIFRSTEQGHGAAQAAASDVISDLKPTWLVLVGIAGAVPETEFSLGDVVVASRMIDFSVTATLPDGTTETAHRGAPAHKAVQDLASRLPALQSRLGDWNTPARLGVSLPSVSIDEDHLPIDDGPWKDKLRATLEYRFQPRDGKQPRLPIVTAAPIASGNMLMKDPAVLQAWLKFARDLKAVEMELPGVYEAAHQKDGNIPVLAVRGISDIVGFKRDPAWTDFACRTAASLTRALLEQKPIPPKSKQHKAIIALREHSEVVLNRVADCGPKGLTFRRADLANELAEAAAASQIVLIIGSAGSGKSVLAKRYVRSRVPQHFTFVFAAEEFHAAHIDKVLSDAQVGMNWISLHSLLPTQSEKLFLIEGLERLLESDDRQALFDLLKAIADDKTLRLVITCRDYHAETVERTMLRPSGVAYKRVVVPELTDDELVEAVRILPVLEVPLASTSLRRLLRNPFMLAHAAELAWPIDQPLPVTERALRERLWSEVVCSEAHPRDALPTRRAAALTKIALDRARSLRPFVDQSDGDFPAIQALASDNLIVFDSPQRQRAAPAHDVFEDWALIEWLSSEFAAAEKDARTFAHARESYPALRRAYRKWLYELIESEPAIAVVYLSDVTLDATVSDYLRDDTLIAIFQSSVSVNFLSNFGSYLMENEARLLCRAIHLVRVACKTVSPLAPKDAGMARQWHIPSGTAWPNLLNFLASEWDAVPRSVYPLILGFLEDWANGVSWQTPYPAGAEAVGILLGKLLPHAQDGWRGESEKKRVLSLISRVPKVVEPLFKDLVRRAQAISRRREDSDAELFAETILKPFQSVPACRDFPNEVINLCLTMWKSKQTPDKSSYYSGLREVDSVFGIAENLRRDFFPASALQGPFKHLLLFHPDLAIRFIVSLMNYAAEHYGQGRARLQFVEEPELANMTFPNGTLRQVWANACLWNAFRGNSVVPYLLQSALMALEAWALEMIERPQAEEFVKGRLDWILQNTNNVSLISVVASVCMAQPSKTGETNLALLGCRDFFDYDRQRLGVEFHSFAPGGMGLHEKLFQEERLASNKLPHRRRDLEKFTLDLQLGTLRDRVWAILDQHLADLPPLDQQDDGDRIWRLCLSRMDLRKYEHTGVTQDGYSQIQMRQPESDIQAVIDRSAPELDRHSRHLSLFLWSINQFERGAGYADKVSEWRSRLEEAKICYQAILAVPEEMGMPSGGPGIVAAVCIRDHWDELDADDRQWCTATILDHVLRSPVGEDSTAFVAKNPFNGVPACAHVLPLMRIRSGPDQVIENGMIAALLHFNEEVRLHAIQGVSEFVLDIDSRLAAFCIWVLVEQAAKWNEINKSENDVEFDKRSTFMAKMIEAANHIMQVATNAWYETFPDLQHLSFGTWPERQLARELITLFRTHPRSPQAHEYFSRVGAALRVWWAIDRRRNGGGERDYELEHLAEEAYAAFLLASDTQHALQLVQPLLDAVSKSPDKVAELFRWLLTLEDGRTSSTPFWSLWRIFTEQVRKAPWLTNIDSEHAHGQSLVRVTFLNTRWNEGIRSWSRLGRNFVDIDNYFQSVPASTFVLESYSHYLYHIGKDSLPNAFVLIADKFGDSLGTSISSDGNLRWYLDALMDRVIYEDLKKLKATPRLRAATMSILDALVQAGSSVAFQLRDDFVTPNSNEVDSTNLKGSGSE